MMEHINDILASDLLERYVLGDVSADEQMKVDLLRIEHRVIRSKLEELELALEKTALENAVKAPPSVKECIIKNIHGEQIKQTSSIPTATQRPWWQLAAALFLGCLGTWAFMNNQLSSAEQSLSSANETINEQSANLEILHRDCDRLTQQYTFINHTNTIPVLLKGNLAQSENRVVIYWNERLQKSMLRVIELPGLKSHETFQLWADVKGEMMSLGVFDASQAIVDAIPMNYLANATSLNITIEPQGGSEHPNVSRLTVSEMI